VQRFVWLADSFGGLPPADATNFPGDAVHQGADGIAILKANSVGLVRRAAKALDVEPRVRFLEGFFNESLPRALPGFTAFAILRLDGDLYQSTLESLHYLYPLLSVGGHVVVDDFTDWQVRSLNAGGCIFLGRCLYFVVISFR
jgi:hypothetical protein